MVGIKERARLTGEERRGRGRERVVKDRTSCFEDQDRDRMFDTLDSILCIELRRLGGRGVDILPSDREGR